MTPRSSVRLRIAASAPASVSPATSHQDRTAASLDTPPPRWHSPGRRDSVPVLPESPVSADSLQAAELLNIYLEKSYLLIPSYPLHVTAIPSLSAKVSVLSARMWQKQKRHPYGHLFYLEKHQRQKCRKIFLCNLFIMLC